jgi:sensor histidine kinase YesM
MRFSADFNYEISCDKNIDEDYHELPPMLIQPFIENSMKHGLLHKTGEKKININFALDDKEEYIICTISDNGIGRKKSAEIKMNNQNIHSSFSINSIEERLQLFNKELQLKQLIIYNDILDEHHNCIGTKVILLIPLI